MDIINKLFNRFPTWFKTIFDHNRWKTLSLVVFAVFGGCMLSGSKTESVESPGKKVNRNQLYAEYQTFLVRYTAATKDLDAKDAMREQALSILQQLSSNSSIPFVPIAGAGLGLLLGVAGGSLDKRRADRQIDILKNQPMMVVKDPGPIEIPVNSVEPKAVA